jgi:V8-like Glu-specific endopeptidase
MLIFMLIHLCFAQIFHDDDRVDYSQMSAIDQKLARSLPALVLKTKITFKDDMIEFNSRSLVKDNKVCAEEKFSDESLVANCSGTLIGSRHVMTAAHCLNEKEGSPFSCSNYAVVFDYFDNAKFLPKRSFYQCKKVIYDSAKNGFIKDIAIIELDRKVTDRKPIQFKRQLPKINDPIKMLGYPYGISIKKSEGQVLGINKKSFAIKHDLDTFSVNSGSGIFNQDNKLIGVLVRSTGYNFQWDEPLGCFKWQNALEKDYAEANYLKFINLFKLLKTTIN